MTRVFDCMELSGFFLNNKSVALAFSGGVDSSYLLYAAKRFGADVTAYYVNSQFQPAFELEDARRLAGELNAPLRVIALDVLSDETICRNRTDRCYYCKKRILTAVSAAAKEDGRLLLIDGANADDSATDRPGMRAAEELSVRSPLRECGLTKERIRTLSKEAGLFTWDKPAYACLATRIGEGERLTAEKLFRAERAESLLFSMGFSDFRVRSRGDTAVIQLPDAQFSLWLENRRTITRRLKQEYGEVFLDTEGRV